MFCDSTDEINCNFEVYTVQRDNSVVGLVTRIVHEFACENHRLFLDHRYYLPVLLRSLFGKDVYHVGTAMISGDHCNAIKSLPPVWKTGKVEERPEGSKAWPDFATKWHDQREVHAMSTIHEDRMVQTRGTLVGPGISGDMVSMKPSSLSLW